MENNFNSGAAPAPAAAVSFTTPAPQSIPTPQAAPVIPSAPVMQTVQPMQTVQTVAPTAAQPMQTVAVPGSYVLQNNGQVVFVPAQPVVQTVPAAPAVKPEPPIGTWRSRYNKKGLEKRKYLRRACNSVGLSMLFDVFLSSYAQIFTLLTVIALLFTISIPQLLSMSADMLEYSMSGGDINEYYNESMNSLGLFDTYLVYYLTAALTSLVVHPTVAYVHAVRQKIDAFSVFKKGTKSGAMLPAGALMALGATYAWVFIYSLLGMLFPDCGLFGSAMTLGVPEDVSPAAMIAMAFASCIVAPVVEEFMFRGVLLKSLSKYGVMFAAVVTSVTFGLLHGNLLQTPFATAVGFVLAYIAIKTGSIRTGIIIHFIVNFYSTACELWAYFAPESADLVNAVFIGGGAIFVLGAVVVTCVTAKKWRWTPADPAANNVLRPQVQSAAKHKYVWCFLLSLPMLLFYAVFALSAFGTSALTTETTEFISALFSVFAPAVRI